MTQPSFLDTPQGRRLAYHRTEGAGPTVVFLGGFMSDMEGTKALHLEDWAQRVAKAKSLPEKHHQAEARDGEGRGVEIGHDDAPWILLGEPAAEGGADAVASAGHDDDDFVGACPFRENLVVRHGR